MVFVKQKLKLSHLANHNNADKAMSQSEHEAKNMQPAPSAGKRVCKSIHDWLLFVLLLIG